MTTTTAPVDELLELKATAHRLLEMLNEVDQLADRCDDGRGLDGLSVPLANPIREQLQDVANRLDGLEDELRDLDALLDAALRRTGQDA